MYVLTVCGLICFRLAGALLSDFLRHGCSCRISASGGVYAYMQAMVGSCRHPQGTALLGTSTLVEGGTGQKPRLQARD